MFNNLSEKLDKAFHILKGHGKITEVNVAETLKEVRRALLDADVNFKIAKECGDVDSHTVGILIPRFEFIDWFTVVPFEKVIYEYQPQGVIG